MNKLRSTLLAAALVLAGAATGIAQTADEILQKHIDAVGGAANWNKITTMKMIGTMNNNGMEIGFTKTVVNDKGIRQDISAMGTNSYIIITPTEGWMFLPGMDKVTAMPAEQLKMSKTLLNVKTEQLVNKADIGKIELVGRDTVNKVPCYKLKITSKEGNEVTAFFDAATYYMVRNEAKANVQNEEQLIAVNYSNFKKQPEGITIPMTVSTPMGVDVTFKSVEINKPVNENIFKPAEDKK
jgi:hypothetical protein